MSQLTQKRFLIVLSSKLALDQYFALVVYTNYLVKAGATVQILADKKYIEKFFSYAKLDNKIKIVEKLPKQKFLLQFPGQTADVENVQWTQTNDVLDIYINMRQNELNVKSMKFVKLGANYDYVIFFSVADFDEVKEFFSEDTKYILENRHITSIGIKSKNIKVTEVIEKPKSSTIAEDIFNLIFEKDYKLSKKEANLLLSAIFFATKQFSEDVKTPETYLVASKLLELGATNKAAKNVIKKIQ